MTLRPLRATKRPAAKRASMRPSRIEASRDRRGLRPAMRNGYRPVLTFRLYSALRDRRRGNCVPKQDIPDRMPAAVTNKVFRNLKDSNVYRAYGYLHCPRRRNRLALRPLGLGLEGLRPARRFAFNSVVRDLRRPTGPATAVRVDTDMGARTGVRADHRPSLQSLGIPVHRRADRFSRVSPHAVCKSARLLSARGRVPRLLSRCGDPGVAATSRGLDHGSRLDRADPGRHDLRALWTALARAFDQYHVGSAQARDRRAIRDRASPALSGRATRAHRGRPAIYVARGARAAGAAVLVSALPHGIRGTGAERHLPRIRRL